MRNWLCGLLLLSTTCCLNGALYAQNTDGSPPQRLRRRVAVGNQGHSVGRHARKKYTQGKFDNGQVESVTAVKVRSAFPLSAERTHYYGASSGNPQFDLSGARTGLKSGIASQLPFSLSGQQSGYQQAAEDEGPFALGQRQSGLEGGSNDKAPFGLGDHRFKYPGDVPDREIALLGSHDVVVILDKSYSMGTRDCPAPSWDGSLFGLFRESRWRWCFDQLHDLTRQMTRLPNRSISVVLFDSKYWVFRDLRLQQLPELFAEYHPWNGTHLAPPLASQFNDYFQRRASGVCRPLLIAVITDGRPHDEKAVRLAIANAARRIHRPGEITITFLQVGGDPKGEWFVEALSHGAGRRGHRYGMIQAHTFPEIVHVGLTRSLISAIGPG